MYLRVNELHYRGLGVRRITTMRAMYCTGLACFSRLGGKELHLNAYMTRHSKSYSYIGKYCYTVGAKLCYLSRWKRDEIIALLREHLIQVRNPPSVAEAMNTVREMWHGNRLILDDYYVRRRVNDALKRGIADANLSTDSSFVEDTDSARKRTGLGIFLNLDCVIEINASRGLIELLPGQLLLERLTAQAGTVNGYARILRQELV